MFRHLLPEPPEAVPGPGHVPRAQRASRLPLRGLRGGDGQLRQRGEGRPHPQADRHAHPGLHAGLLLQKEGEEGKGE